MEEKYLVVSIHDAMPQFKPQLKQIVSGLENIGINKKSILVIPDYLGKNNISHDGKFVDWLHQCEKQGSEIAQHGLEHISTNHNYRSPIAKFIGTRITHGCGEFQNISYEESVEKIEKGRGILQSQGFEPTGFVAPAWLLNKESERAIRERFSYTTKFGKIEFYSQDRTEPSNVIVFTSGKGIVNKGFEMYNSFLLNKKFKNQRIARVAIHPQDLESGFFQTTIDAISQLMHDRTITTYQELAK